MTIALTTINPIRNPNCTLCDLHLRPELRYTTCLVPNTGLDEYDVMLVAENVTPTDDQNGSSFLGGALKSIRTYLEEQGLKVYCTYATKCMKPGKTFKIVDKHLKTCASNYLSKEIASVKPKHIIVLGAGAMYAACGKKGISEKRGSRFFDEKLQAHIYPTVHQAQAMYDDIQRKALWSDLSIFTSWIKGEIDPEASRNTFDPPVYEVSTIAALRKVQKLIRAAGGIVAVDCETSGLNAYDPTGYIRTIQFCWDTEFGGVFVPLNVGPGCYFGDPSFPAPQYWDDGKLLPEALEIIREILAESKCIWHNGKFDRIWLHIWGCRITGSPILAPNIFMDTLHVAHLLNENRRLGLKKLITEELGYETYDIADKLTKDLSLLFVYAAKDTVASYLLAQKYSENLKAPGMERVRALYKHVIKKADAVFTKMEMRGWPVDEQRAQEVFDDLTAKHFLIENEMMAILGGKGLNVVYDTPVVAKGEFYVDAKTFGSYIKLGNLLFNAPDDPESPGLGYPMHPDRKVAYTETGGRSTQENALVHIKHDPFISLLLDWKGLGKAISTYALPMLTAAKERGRLTTSYKLTGTVTGRTASGKEGKGKSSNGMNLQNLPHDERRLDGKPPLIVGIRNIIKPAVGRVILESDFSQLELRVAAELSQDKMLLHAFQNNIDLHAFRGMRMAQLDEVGWAALKETDPKKWKDLRTKAKPVNFGFLYGMGASKFKMYALTDYDVDFTMTECLAIRAKFFEDHAGLEAWYRRQEQEGHHLGYVTSLSGRRRHLPNLKLNPERSQDIRQKYEEARRYSINTPVQGFGSDLKLMALIQIAESIDESRGFLIGEVHDSIVVECDEDYAYEVGAIMISAMRNPKLLDVLGIKLTVPIDADAKIGISLGEAKEVEIATKGY